ncbi:MAG: DUF3429 family protein [Pseudomonadota bacterium]
MHSDTRSTYPDWLQQAIGAARVTILASRLTDCRRLEQTLAAAGISLQRLPLSMDSAANRAAFHAVQAQLDWPHLPMIFLDGKFVGGEPELESRLTENSADTAGTDPADTVTSTPQPLPRTLQGLAYAGLLPFFAGALAGWLPSLPFAPFLQALLVPYAALIASLMAGSHWGIAVSARAVPRMELMLAVSFMLFSWPLLLLPDALALTGLLLIFAGLLTTEPRLLRRGLVNRQYFRLRLWLSGGVLLALGLALLRYLR